ncbi:MAG: aldo/keto reductase [Tepidisphaeraceae bacterium]|jgi:hypothetical protein
MRERTTRREFLERTGCLAAAMAVGTCAGTAKGEVPALPLPRRPLGKTGVEVSILGLGADGFVTDTTDQDDVERFLNEVLDAGVHYFDTAYVYGKDGQSEKNLGLVMGGKRRKEAFLATKTGSRTYDGAMKQVTESLRRLRTDYLDLIQMQHISRKDDVKALGRKDGALAALEKLRDQGVVRFVGLTGHPQDPQVKQAMAMYEWDTLMCFVNPAAFSEPALREQIPLAQKKGMGIIGMKTFGGRPGSLVGNAAGEADAGSLLRFALSCPISVAIPGVMSRRQFRENLEVVRNFRPMSDKETAGITQRIGSGTTPWER